MSLASLASMKVDDCDSLSLYVGNLSRARAFHADVLGLPIRFEGEIIVVVGGPSGEIILRDLASRDSRCGHPEGQQRWTGVLPF